MKSNKWKIWMHILAGASFFIIVKLLLKYRFDFRPIYIVRIVYILILSFLLSPFRIVEFIFYSKKIKNQNVVKDPVFIIGHWRSGTTYLHNLLCNDEQFGFISTFQAFIPKAFIIGNPILKFGSSLSMPAKRPMDDVDVHPDYPQEDEFAISNQSTMSLYNCLYFPSFSNELAAKYLFFETISSKELINWKKMYLLLIKKITLANGGKQCMLKNPVNTCRIPVLLEMFPNAKFIYISRNAKETIASTKNMQLKFCEINSLESYDSQEMEENIVAMFYKMEEIYKQDRMLIPTANLVEVNYSDLVFKTEKVMQQIYEQLQLEGYTFAKQNIDKYILLQKNYKRFEYK